MGGYPGKEDLLIHNKGHGANPNGMEKTNLNLRISITSACEAAANRFPCINEITNTPPA